MSALVLDRKLGPGLDTTDPEIGGSAADARVLSTARTLTLNALRRLDGERKGIVLRYLSESKLISTFSLEGDVTDPVVSLAGADLRGVYLKGAVLLRGPGFMTADLRGADFRGAFMEQPLFDFADHRGADFSDAVILDGYVSGCISGARFRRADLDGTQFSYVSGSLVDFSGARLDGVDFREARLAAVKGLSRGARGFRPRQWMPTAPTACAKRTSPARAASPADVAEPIAGTRPTASSVAAHNYLPRGNQHVAAVEQSPPSARELARHEQR